MHLILTGASGVIGTSILNYIVQHAIPAGIVTQLSILTRRPIPYLENTTSIPEIKVIKHTDFETYPPSLLAELQDAQACIWSIGIQISEVPEPEYMKITRDYAVAAAKAFAGLNGGKGFTFVYVSGEGATHNPGAMTMRFARLKGQAEKAVLAAGEQGGPEYAAGLRPLVVRPGGVDPFRDPVVMKAWAERKYGWKSMIYRPTVFSVFDMVYPSMVSDATELGRCLTGIATKEYGAEVKWQGDYVEAEGRVLTNTALKRIIKEDLVP